MPRYRADIQAISPYQVGRPIEEVAREHGIDANSIVKLASNESPEGPFPGVIEAVSAVLESSNRYPDNDVYDLASALSTELGVDRANLLFGNGSTALLADIASAVGGPGTNAVYSWPSFVMYRFASIWSGTEHREIPLGDDFAIDFDAMSDAVDSDTRLVLICNPNNPTGTLTSSDAVESFVASLPDDLLIVVDEAYFEYVDDPGYRTAISLAIDDPRVVVLRTFSKIFGLAGYRVGYGVGHPETMTELRKAQQPMTVGFAGQVAAIASLGQPGEICRRAEVNSAARHHLSGVLEERGLPFAESHTNFIFFKPGEDSDAIADAFTHQGVIVRPMSGGWVRVTIGTEAENQRFVAALDGLSEAG